jgi:hypothetical protein
MLCLPVCNVLSFYFVPLCRRQIKIFLLNDKLQMRVSAFQIAAAAPPAAAIADLSHACL